MANAFKQQQDEQKQEALLADCRALMAAGKRVEAVKKYRTATKAFLAEAQRVLANR